MMSKLDRLGEHGADYKDPLSVVDWSATSPSLPWLPPSLLSLAGLDAQKNMSAEALARFSQIEFARLCAAGLWLEGLMISRTTSEGFPVTNINEARVMLQEVREESGHGLLFLEMIERAGLSGVELLGPKRLLTWISHKLSPASPEFWALVFIGESVTDTFTVKALQLSQKQGNGICPVAHQVLSLHHRDEARHIAAARTLLGARVQKMSLVRKQIFNQALRHLLPQFLTATLYPTSASLEVLGFSRPYHIVKAVRACPVRQRIVEACAAPALEALARMGLYKPDRSITSQTGNTTEATQ
ncbi:MAG: diiron oxygenase [Rhodospirillaceae bacterium]|jgi:hypothetical protein